MSSKGSKPRTKKDLTPEDQQRERDPQEIQKRTSSVANEAEELLNEAADLAELPPVNDVDETAVLVPEAFLSLLDASHAANRKKSSVEQPKKSVKGALGGGAQDLGHFFGALRQACILGGSYPKGVSEGVRKRLG